DGILFLSQQLEHFLRKGLFHPVHLSSSFRNQAILFLVIPYYTFPLYRFQAKTVPAELCGRENSKTPGSIAPGGIFAI
ncbi:MAG: hypothetical protein IJD20_01250, partial [Oscillospiraceae bacterium]|nr:hypothetical protein [Oscillospiraceae bacterium]